MPAGLLQQVLMGAAARCRHIKAWLRFGTLEACELHIECCFNLPAM